MAAEIYYFTGTGNSLALARQLAEGLGDTRLTMIRETGGAEDQQPVVPAGEVLGIVSPVYCFGLPLPVVRFIRRLQCGGVRYVFMVSDCAGNAGFALQQGGELLAGQGLKLNAALNVFMPTNYLPFGGAWADSRQQAAFERSGRELTVFIEKLKARAGVSAKRSWLPFFISRMIYRMFSPKLAQCGKRFLVSDACTGCGLCSRICPVRNITMENNRPVWGERCAQCLACIQWCPCEAITIKGVDPTRSHYHHPAVTADDLLRANGNGQKQEN